MKKAKMKFKNFYDRYWDFRKAFPFEDIRRAGMLFDLVDLKKII